MHKTNTAQELNTQIQLHVCSKQYLQEVSVEQIAEEDVKSYFVYIDEHTASRMSVFTIASSAYFLLGDPSPGMELNSEDATSSPFLEAEHFPFDDDFTKNTNRKGEGAIKPCEPSFASVM